MLGEPADLGIDELQHQNADRRPPETVHAAHGIGEERPRRRRPVGDLRRNRAAEKRVQHPGDAGEESGDHEGEQLVAPDRQAGKLGALIVGEFEAFGMLVSAELAMPMLYLIMAVILIIRPTGILGVPDK